MQVNPPELSVVIVVPLDRQSEPPIGARFVPPKATVAPALAVNSAPVNENVAPIGPSAGKGAVIVGLDVTVNWFVDEIVPSSASWASTE